MNIQKVLHYIASLDKGGSVCIKTGQYRHSCIQRQFNRKGAREIVHKNEEATKLDSEGKYKVQVEHDAFEEPPTISFKVNVVSESVGILRTLEFQEESFTVGRQIIEAFKEYLQKKEIKLGLMALELGKLQGFEVDFSKGIEVFLANMLERYDLEELGELEEDTRLSKSGIFRSAIENELKKRGAIKND